MNELTMWAEAGQFPGFELDLWSALIALAVGFGATGGSHHRLTARPPPRRLFAFRELPCNTHLDDVGVWRGKVAVNAASN
jgi:hypothetical protein